MRDENNNRFRNARGRGVDRLETATARRSDVVYLPLQPERQCDKRKTRQDTINAYKQYT